MWVIYVDIDSMRPSHIGAYGYHRNTTPNIDRIAKQGVVFTHCYCGSSPCVPSRASFASGLFAFHHGLINHDSTLCFRQTRSHDRPMFVRYLREHGYKAVTFSSFADRHDGFWYQAGWNEAHTPTLKKGWEDAQEIVDPVLNWLDRNKHEDSVFLHVQLWDPHRNYTMPASHKELFAETPAPSWPDEAAIASHQDCYGPFSAQTLHPLDYMSPTEVMPTEIGNRGDFKSFVDAYDGAVHYMDEQLGRLFSALEERGIMKDASVIISADHGEGMGEHGVYGDHTCADEAVHHIPLIVKWPGSSCEHPSVGDLVYNIDLHPTICDLLDIETPSGWDGRSFAGVMRGKRAMYKRREYLVLEHALYSISRTVRTEEWLLMRTYHPGVVPLEPVELYNVAGDPYLTRNLAEEYPQMVMQLDHHLQEWWQEQTAKSPTDVDPLPEAIRRGPFKIIGQERWAEKLREIGRDDLRESYLERIRSFR